jgi:hypothetical protein
MNCTHPSIRRVESEAGRRIEPRHECEACSQILSIETHPARRRILSNCLLILVLVAIAGTACCLYFGR